MTARLGSAKVPQHVVALNNGSGYLTGASSVVASDQHTCAIVSGTADCWGDSTYGQLGNSSVTATQVNYPVAVTGISTATALSAGIGVDDSQPELDTCALLYGGTIKCWGDNTYDQLGTGKIGHSEVPVTVSGGHRPLRRECGRELRLRPSLLRRHGLVLGPQRRRAARERQHER